jgi:glycosyltransferase involved in cell wall biosynthesis
VKNPRDPVRRLAVVLSHPTQYYSPWFRHLAASGRLDLKVFYLWDFGVRAQFDPGFRTTVKWDVDLLSGYSHAFVPNQAKRPGTDRFLGLRNPGLTAALSEWNPDAILVFGYKSYTHLRLIFWARIRGIPLVFRGDSHFIGRAQPGFARKLLLRLIYRQFSAITYVGSANRDYFKALGVQDNHLFFAPHSVDDSLFDATDPRHLAAAAILRKELGLSPSTRVFLFAGRLVPEKQPRELLEAFLSLCRNDTALVFVGEGTEKASLQATAGNSPESQHGPKVRFLPFANQSEMPSRYLLADVFVLPSRGVYETWGLAVNEAMHMGIPCIVSDRVGCQQDLVQDGKTGWVFESMDTAALGRVLAEALRAIESPERRAEIVANMKNLISAYTYVQATDGLVTALASLRC